MILSISVGVVFALLLCLAYRVDRRGQSSRPDTVRTRVESEMMMGRTWRPGQSERRL